MRRWPTGNYAIPMSPYGCPIKPDDAWTQSSLNLTFGRDEIILSQINTKSMGHDLYVGPYGSYSFQLNFCVKTATEAESTVATAEREWPPGDYAVFAMGDDCPSGKLPQVPGCTLIFSCIRRLGIFGGFKILNYSIFGGFKKKIGV